MRYLLTAFLVIVIPAQTMAYERGVWLQAPTFVSTVEQITEVSIESEASTSTASTIDATASTTASSTDLAIAASTTDPYFVVTATSSPRLNDMITTARALGMTQVYLRFPAIFDDQTGELLGGGVGDHQNFAAALDAFAAVDIDVYAWIVNGRRTMEDQWGDGTESGFQWVDLCSEDEQAAQALWVTTILERYPTLSGIELDYIRYSNWELAQEDKIACVTDTVESVSGAVRSAGDQYKVSAAVFPMLYSYAGWTQTVEFTVIEDTGVASTATSSIVTTATTTEVVWDGDTPQWFKDWYSNNPDNSFVAIPRRDSKTGLYEARTKSEYDEAVVFAPHFLHYQQDPVDWLRRDLLDTVHVMQYSVTPDIWYPEAAVWEELAPDVADRVMMGLGWLDNESQWDDWTHDPEALVSLVDHAESSGLAGTALFTLGTYPDLDAILIDTLLATHTATTTEPTPTIDVVEADTSVVTDTDTVDLDAVESDQVTLDIDIAATSTATTTEGSVVEKDLSTTTASTTTTTTIPTTSDEDVVATTSWATGTIAVATSTEATSTTTNIIEPELVSSSTEDQIVEEVVPAVVPVPARPIPPSVPPIGPYNVIIEQLPPELVAAMQAVATPEPAATQAVPVETIVEPEAEPVSAPESTTINAAQ